MGPVKVYGAEWCGDTQATLEFLREAGVEYEYHDIDGEEGAEDWVREHNDGKRKLPTVEIGGAGGLVMSVPDDLELESKLRETGLLA